MISSNTEISETELRDMFAQSGTVELVSIPVDKVTGEARGFAFVDMSSPEELDVAVEKLSGTSCGDRTIRVSKSLSKDEVKKRAAKRGKFNCFVFMGVRILPIFHTNTLAGNILLLNGKTKTLKKYMLAIYPSMQ